MNNSSFIQTWFIHNWYRVFFLDFIFYPGLNCVSNLIYLTHLKLYVIVFCLLVSRTNCRIPRRLTSFSKNKRVCVKSWKRQRISRILRELTQIISWWKNVLFCFRLSVKMKFARVSAECRMLSAFSVSVTSEWSRRNWESWDLNARNKRALLSYC